MNSTGKLALAILAVVPAACLTGCTPAAFAVNDMHMASAIDAQRLQMTRLQWEHVNDELEEAGEARRPLPKAIPVEDELDPWTERYVGYLRLANELRAQKGREPIEIPENHLHWYMRDVRPSRTTPYHGAGARQAAGHR